MVGGCSWVEEGCALRIFEEREDWEMSDGWCG